MIVEKKENRGRHKTYKRHEDCLFFMCLLQRCHLVAVATAVFIVHRQRMYVLPESAASSFSSFSSYESEKRQ